MSKTSRDVSRSWRRGGWASTDCRSRRQSHYRGASSNGIPPWRWQLSASRQQPPRAARPLALRRAPHRPVHGDLPQGRGQGRGAGVEAQQFVAVGCHSVLSCIIRLSELDAARCWLTGCSGSECGERGLAGRGPTIMDILCTEATEVL